MNAEHVRSLRDDHELLKRLAKYIALYSFRNTHLETLHSGISPDSKTGDFSDVKVVSPFGEIPWQEVSRLNDDEMKALMIDVVNSTYATMVALFAAEDAVAGEILAKLREKDPAPAWDEPRVPSKWIEGNFIDR
jgi:hypothetical protein